MNNPYVTQAALQAGMSEREVRRTATPMSRRTFPCVIHGRQYDCEEDYMSAMYEFLNGN